MALKAFLIGQSLDPEALDIIDEINNILYYDIVQIVKITTI